MSDWQDHAVAVIGMAGRFPGAADVRQFWENLRAGKETIVDLSDEQMRAQEVDEELLRDPHLVRRMGVLDGVDQFAASFFGFSRRDAAVMDPQQRIFLECAWEALENAGYDPKGCPGAVGVFAGVGLNRYLLHHMKTRPAVVERLGELEQLIGGDKDFLATRVAYKLNLSGPAVTLQTACSTSLVTVVMACQNLLSYGCDMALAGGVTIHTPSCMGYVYQQGGTLSPDGRCRAFDVRAAGMVPGNGVGIVALKRLKEAMKDGDMVYAVIRGAAINNDGSGKVGFTAPSVEGQAQVITMAQALAEVEPQTIGFVETHGTGTDLGDSIEIAALTQAFGEQTAKGSIALGAVKTNVGHLDTAAGVTGLIKTVMALHQKEIPATLHFETPNPRLQLDKTPFQVNTKLRPWVTENVPRRAGVSSFGIGGTNAHVVLEEAPAMSASSAGRPQQLILLSAQTAEALEASAKRLGAHLEEKSEVALADVAYTLQMGRHAMTHRAAYVSGAKGASAKLLQQGNAVCIGTVTDGQTTDVAFLFPGQGSQHVQMARGLYETEKTFREQVDFCAGILKPELGVDLREKMWPEAANEAAASGELDQTALTQPTLFVIEYCLARLWMNWGIKPAAMAGHSIGEYVAACLAGVMGLEDALRIVAIRGKLMQAAPPGAMVAVALPAAQVEPLLNDGLGISVVNEANGCVVGGTIERIERFAQELQGRNVASRKLRTSHAFHSAGMDGVLAPFEKALRQFRLQPPKIKIVSNVTGTWLTDGQATDPGYWAKHLRMPVQFAACLSTLLETPRRVLLEVGPGTTLTTLAARHERRGMGHRAVSSCRHPKQNVADEASLLAALGNLWVSGIVPDWQAFYAQETRRRVALPAYPFERQRYWLSDIETASDPVKTESKPAQTRRADLENFFYLPIWREKELAGIAGAPATRRWMLLGTDDDFADRLAESLRDLGQKVAFVRHPSDGDSVSGADGAKTAKRLFSNADVELGGVADVLVDLSDLIPSSVDVVANAQATTARILHLAQAIGEKYISQPLTLLFLTRGLHGIAGAEAAGPGRAAALGALRVAAREISTLQFRAVDLATEHAANEAAGKLAAARLLREMQDDHNDSVVAYRGARRFVQDVQPIELALPQKNDGLAEEGVYLITGGLGGIGLALAEALAQGSRAKLVLVGRSGLPPREEWERLPAENSLLRQRIETIKKIEQAGGQVHVLNADTSDSESVRSLLRQVREQFGRLDGIVHAAGIAPGGAIPFRSAKDIVEVVGTKVAGAVALLQALKEFKLQPRFIVYCSSLAAVIGVPGQIDYSAANAVLDAMAQAQESSPTPHVISINWDTWSEVGMAVHTEANRRLGSIHEEAIREGLKTSEGVEAFFRILNGSWPQVMVSTRPLAARLALPTAVAASHEKTSVGDSEASDAPARGKTVADQVAQIWCELLGLKTAVPENDFFALGGHSLLAVQIVHRLQDLLHIDLTPDAIFQHSTLNELTNHVESLGNANGSDNGKAAAVPAGEMHTEHLLNMVESLSDEEVQAMLEKELAGNKPN